MTNCVFSCPNVMNANEVCIIGENSRRNQLKKLMRGQNPRLSVREYDNSLRAPGSENNDFDISDHQAVVIFSGQWRRLYKQLQQKGIKNCCLYFGYGDELIFPGPPRFHAMKAALWLIKEAACGRITSRDEFDLLKEVALWGYAGYFHDIQLTRHHTTFSVAGPRKNPPFRDLAYQHVLWGCIQHGLQRDLAGKKLLDIGCAEGYFSFQANRLGAKVVAINPPTNSLPCAAAITRHIKKTQEIGIIAGYFPEVGGEELADADIIFLLGTLHHFSNLEEALAPILELRKTLVLEAVFFAGHSEKIPGLANRFDPRHHGLTDKRICPQWLTGYLNNHSYRFRWLDAWQEFVDRPGNNTFSYDMYCDAGSGKNMPGPRQNKTHATRRLLVAEPQ